MTKTRPQTFVGPALFTLVLHLGCGDGSHAQVPDQKAVDLGAGVPAAVDPAPTIPTPVPAGAPPVAADPGLPPASDPGQPPAVPPGTPVMAPPAPPAASGPHTSVRSIPLYDDNKVVDFYVDFAPGDWDKMLAPGDAKEDARWVHCSFKFEQEVFPDAACRRKGNVTDWPFERKPQFLVRFNQWNPKGRFRGLRRLNFESFDALEAPVRDRIGMFAMRKAGIDAPRVNHARVFKDGQQLGLYMNVETIDKEFLEDHYGPAGSNGNLWKGGYEIHTNETNTDQRKLQALNGLVDHEPLGVDHSQFAQSLAPLMDVPEVLREMAVETALVVSDNFSNGSTNFYYYEHPTRGFVALPWDLDSIITTSPADSDPFAFWAGSMPNKLREIINETPELRAAYVAALVEVRDAILALLPAEVDRVCAQIRPFMLEEPTRAASFAKYEEECAQIKTSIAARSQALTRLLGR